MVNAVMDLSKVVGELQRKYKIIGRKQELTLLLLALNAKKHIILEGAVGTGKTYLARALAEYSDAKFYRIDGSEDVLSHTLTGYFDPPVVIAKGYTEDAFIYGPLSKAMQDGGCLFINELNRIPESTQNVLLSALDEHTLIIPKLKTISANGNGFITIATQNPAAHVGVSALGEALKDRFVWIHVDYQTEDEEIEITELNLDKIKDHYHLYATIAVKIVDLTREHPDIRRGSSIRGAIDLAQLIEAYGKSPGMKLWKEAAVMALHSKIEMIDGTDRNPREVIIEIVEAVLENFQ
ncbi:AAA family ATPase [Candidatus Lokiarchaeum ossiferum]|uniref:AAA family ATPase n=1 Tax=Candidatus Lokiarchaeum ossiferum TaxID=2951803 RepID=UPI00352DE127